MQQQLVGSSSASNITPPNYIANIANMNGTINMSQQRTSSCTSSLISYSTNDKQLVLPGGGLQQLGRPQQQGGLSSTSLDELLRVHDPIGPLDSRGTMKISNVSNREVEDIATNKIVAGDEIVSQQTTSRKSKPGRGRKNCRGENGGGGDQNSNSGSAVAGSSGSSSTTHVFFSNQQRQQQHPRGEHHHHQQGSLEHPYRQGSDSLSWRSSGPSRDEMVNRGSHNLRQTRENSDSCMLDDRDSRGRFDRHVNTVELEARTTTYRKSRKMVNKMADNTRNHIAREGEESSSSSSTSYLQQDMSRGGGKNSQGKSSQTASGPVSHHLFPPGETNTKGSRTSNYGSAVEFQYNGRMPSAKGGKSLPFSDSILEEEVPVGGWTSADSGSSVSQPRHQRRADVSGAPEPAYHDKDTSFILCDNSRRIPRVGSASSSSGSFGSNRSLPVDDARNDAAAEYRLRRITDFAAKRIEREAYEKKNKEDQDQQSSTSSTERLQWNRPASSSIQHERNNLVQQETRNFFRSGRSSALPDAKITSKELLSTSSSVIASKELLLGTKRSVINGTPEEHPGLDDLRTEDFDAFDATAAISWHRENFRKFAELASYAGSSALASSQLHRSPGGPPTIKDEARILVDRDCRRPKSEDVMSSIQRSLQNLPRHRVVH
ncbi:unnamed protein product [Amoebophrya sp. A25]|nr:unnamed protein product [Amoebophrya sp. A25]|eukprot:GSA25T00014174001.1